MFRYLRLIPVSWVTIGKVIKFTIIYFISINNIFLCSLNTLYMGSGSLTKKGQGQLPILFAPNRRVMVIDRKGQGRLSFLFASNRRIMIIDRKGVKVNYFSLVLSRLLLNYISAIRLSFLLVFYPGCVLDCMVCIVCTTYAWVNEQIGVTRKRQGALTTGSGGTTIKRTAHGHLELFLYQLSACRLESREVPRYASDTAYIQLTSRLLLSYISAKLLPN